MLPHEGTRKRLGAWRGRDAAKDFAEAAAAGEEPAAPPAEEAGDVGTVAFAAQPVDWHESEGETPDFSRWEGGGAQALEGV